MSHSRSRLTMDSTDAYSAPPRSAGRAVGKTNCPRCLIGAPNGPSQMEEQQSGAYFLLKKAGVESVPWRGLTRSARCTPGSVFLSRVSVAADEIRAGTRCAAHSFDKAMASAVPSFRKHACWFHCHSSFYSPMAPLLAETRRKLKLVRYRLSDFAHLPGQSIIEMIETINRRPRSGIAYSSSGTWIFLHPVEMDFFPRISQLIDLHRLVGGWSLQQCKIDACRKLVVIECLPPMFHQS